MHCCSYIRVYSCKPLLLLREMRRMLACSVQAAHQFSARMGVGWT